MMSESQRKPQHVVSIDSARPKANKPVPPPEPPANAGKRPNQYTRVSFAEMFVRRQSVRKIARFYRTTELAVEMEIRERLIQNGELNRKAAA